MEKHKAVVMAYQVATLTYPSDEIIEMLMPLSYERTLELLLVLRLSSRPVTSPLNYLRRAISEGWTADTLPQKIDRKSQNVAVRSYMKKGMTREDAEQRYNSWDN